MIFIIIFLFRYKILSHLLQYHPIYNLLVLSGSATILIWQVIIQNRWQRKRNSLDLINMLFKGDMLNVKKVVDKYLKSPNFFSQTYDKVKETFSEEEKEELDDNLEIYLNYLEGIAVGIKYKVYEEKMIYDYIEPIITEIVRWAKPYIDNTRKFFNSDELYIEVEKFANKWRKYHENE